jgi:hypothetical protein
LGPLVLERYPPGQFGFEESVLLTNDREYIWFTGGAIPLAKEIVAVFLSRRGPNADYFARTEKFCFSPVIETHVAFNNAGKGLRLWSAEEDAKNLFGSLGFETGDTLDVERFREGSEIAERTLERLLRSKNPAGPQVPVLRRGKEVTVSIPISSLTAALPDCLAIADRH